jgi:hypothetical protein
LTFDKSVAVWSLQVESLRLEASGYLAQQRTLGNQLVAAEAQLANALNEIATLKDYMNSTLPASNDLEEYRATNQTCKCSNEATVRELEQELESTRSAMVKQAMVCAELQISQFGTSSSSRVQRNSLHRSLDLSWLVRGKSHKVEQDQTQQIASKNHTQVDNGHVVYEVSENKVGWHLQQRLLAANDGQAPASSSCVECACQNLDSTGNSAFAFQEKSVFDPHMGDVYAAMSLEGPLQAVQVDQCESKHQTNDTCSSVVVKALAPSSSKDSECDALMDHQGHLCSRCINLHQTLVSNLNSQHALEIESLQQKHAALLFDAQTLCEDWQVCDTMMVQIVAS